MKFYNRKKELDILEQAFLQKSSSMIIISGRRRVGKSRLVDEFLKKNSALKIMVVPKEEKQAAADLAEVLADEYKPTFNSIKEAFEYFFSKSKSRVIYIDEFPNFLEINPSTPYELQRLWDKYKESTDKILILSGSYIGMMERIFTKQKAPLFNRAQVKIILGPLDQEVIWNMQEIELEIKDPVRKITNYCIFGGIPYYYEVLEKCNNLQYIENLFFGIGQLREEGQDILRQEFGSAYKKYFSIMEAIGYGHVSASEIANKLGIRQTTLSKYLLSMQNDFKLVQRIVPFGQNPHRSKKGIYFLKDNMLAFWFSLVYGKICAPDKNALNLFVSRRFELLCMDFMTTLLSARQENIVRASKWWGTIEIGSGKYEQREIDLIIETDKALYIGECKWSDNKIGESELLHLKQSAKMLKTRKPIKYVLFNKSSFAIKESQDVLLFDVQKITEYKSSI